MSGSNNSQQMRSGEGNVTPPPSNRSDIIGLREHILDNVRVTFPCLYKGKLDPKDIGYNIITYGVYSTQRHVAMVVWGPDHIPFLQGAHGADTLEPLDSLHRVSMNATTAALTAGDLQQVENCKGAVPLHEGFYVRKPEDKL